MATLRNYFALIGFTCLLSEASPISTIEYSGPNLIRNGSFEAAHSGSSTWDFLEQSSDLPLWYFTAHSTSSNNGNILLNTSAFGWGNADDGQYVVGLGFNNGQGSIRQGVHTEIGTSYQLSFATSAVIHTQAGYGNAGALQLGITLSNASTFDAFGNFSTQPTATLGKTFSPWNTYTVEFVAMQSMTYFDFFAGHNPDLDVFIDDISLLAGTEVITENTEAVPEPESAWLLGLGVLTAGLIQKRRKNKMAVG